MSKILPADPKVSYLAAQVEIDAASVAANPTTPDTESMRTES